MCFVVSGQWSLYILQGAARSMEHDNENPKVSVYCHMGHIRIDTQDTISL